MAIDRSDSDGEPPRPTRTRYVLAVWLCGLTGILYLDRICMAQAVVPIQRELGLTNSEISYVLMAFTLAYGLFEIPTGRMGDRFGARTVLTRIVVWWSAFTALTGACTGFLALMGVRFLFGAGEAGAFPNANRVIARWYPVRERGRVQGVMLASGQCGAVFAPIGAAWLIEAVGWRWSFAAFGLVGAAWAVGFWRWFRDDPADHPGVTAAELSEIRDGRPNLPPAHGPVPWRAALTDRGVLVLCLVMMLASFDSYFFYSWFPKYLSAARGLGNVEAGALAAGVLAGSATGMLLGGWLADRISKRSADPVRGRRRLAVGCYLTAAGTLFLGVRCDDPAALAAFWGVSIGAMHVTLPNWWAVAVPQCGRHIGSLTGLMNGSGVIGAMASQWFVGAVADSRAAAGFHGREQWDPMIDVYVAVLVVAAGVWWCYRYRPLED